MCKDNIRQKTDKSQNVSITPTKQHKKNEKKWINTQKNGFKFNLTDFD